MPTENAYLVALETEVEAVLRRHMATYHAAAQAAVARAFRAVAATTTVGVAASAKVTRPQRTRRKSSTPHRSAEMLATLAAQLESAVLAQPGQTMRELSARLDVPAAALAVPMARLKRSGRVRRVGSRQFTRYYPQPRPPVAQTPASAGSPKSEGGARPSMKAV